MSTIKNPKDSLTVMTQIVMPNDTNQMNNLFGGQLLSWMDRCCAISAHRHCKRQVVTSTINNVAFKNPIPHGAIVTIEAKVSRAFTSSMEVIADVFLEEQRPNGARIKANEGIFTFVAVDQLGNPINVPKIEPETELEKERFAAALRRRQLALIIAGKMEPEQATELKALFYPEESQQ
ncbi:MAG: putative acyl-CoA thioester hydrolase [Cryomorphaceae bacterium]|jgi:acyl-CoA hydrolase|nr:MAG: acyl-CoA thioesterase [Bacteroidota bacterium]REK57468.1 MAG: acyl-CoA thioesterase [Bacteroidota bacterium]CAI8173973.1 MAG: putative acyl-CoA thioester hydrolase [Cryomorphaceae bacterium]